MGNQYLTNHPEHAAAWLLFLCLALLAIGLSLAWHLMKALDQNEQQEIIIAEQRENLFQADERYDALQLSYDECKSALDSERIKVEQLERALQKNNVFADQIAKAHLS